MKRIGVYLSSNPYFGGTFQYCEALLDALKELEDENKIKVVVVYNNPHWSQYFLNSKFEHSQAPTFRRRYHILFDFWANNNLPIFLLRIFFYFFHPLIQVFKNKKCDAWIFPSQDIWAAYLMGSKAIATVHDLMHRYESLFPEVGNKNEYASREFLYRNICKFSDVILTDSIEGKKHVAESYGKKYLNKISPLPYTFPGSLTRVVPDLDVLKRRNIPSDNFIFYPAQFWEHKNHLRLLEAFIQVKRKMPSLILILVGSEKNGTENVNSFIIQNDLGKSVYNLGYVTTEEMAGLYKLSKALVMPTFFGPTNIPPMEACYFGCPVVYSKIYGYKEIPVTGMEFVDPSDASSIAEGILNALLHPQKPVFVYNPLEKFKSNLENIINHI